MFLKDKHSNQKGALMLEAIAVLGLMALISPMLYRQISDRNHEIDDVTKASIMRSIRDGLNAYIQANELDIKIALGIADSSGNVTSSGSSATNAAPVAKKYSDLTADQKSNLLATMPPGIDASVFGDSADYNIQFLGYSVPGGILYSDGIAKDAPRRPVVTAMLISNTDVDSQRRAARVASLIGADGGIVTTKATETNQKAYGTLGSWEMTLGSGITAPANSVVALAAYDTTGKNVLNRLTTDLDADGNSIINAKLLQGDTVQAKEKFCLGEDCDAPDASMTDKTIVLGGGTFAEKDATDGMVIHVDYIKPYTVGKALTVAQKTTFNSSVTMKKDLEIEGGLSVKKGAKVAEDAQISKKLFVGTDLTDGSLYSAKIYGDSLRIGSRTAEVGETGVTGCITVASSTLGVENLASQSVAKISDVETTGNCIPYFEVTSTGITAYKPVTIKSKLEVTENTFLRKDAYVDDALYAEKRLVVGGLNRTATSTTETPLLTTNNLPLADSNYPAASSYNMNKAKVVVEDGDVYLKNGRIMTGVAVPNQSKVSNAFTTMDGNETKYYQVDPAYTSVMNDIRLTSRGGARLSQILPNYISKGMYYLTNSYYKGSWPCTTGTCPNYPFPLYDNTYTIVSGTYSNYPDNTVPDTCATKACVSHPYMGRVPAPGQGTASSEGKCPPGYAPLITLLPTAFEMSKISHLMIPTSHTHDLQIDLVTDSQGNVIGATGSTTNPRTSSGESVLLRYDGDKLVPYDPTTTAEDTTQIGYNLIDSNRTFANNKGTGESIAIQETSSQTGALINSKMIGQTDNWLVTLLKPYESLGVTQYWDVAMGLISRVYSGTSASYVWNPQGVAPNTMTLFAQTYCVFDPSAFNFQNSTTSGSFPIPQVRTPSGTAANPSF
ncbi:MAG: hypothetical protein EOM53_02890 [Alphaproteobacteria bacterium]|nr:hypothetical protein [Alphaproteobacteria bacterium]